MSSPTSFSGGNSTDQTGVDVVNYVLCVYSVEGQNPDMQGYAVRLSNFIVNVCLGGSYCTALFMPDKLSTALIIRYSEEDVAESVSVLLLQVYTLMVCAFISLIRKQLSVADAHFSLTSTVSPLALYLLYASMREVLKKPSHLFRRLGSHRTYSILSLLMLPMWIVMNLLIYFADVFADTCPPLTLASWLLFEIEAVLTSFIFASVFTGVIILVWIIYSLRHFRDIRGEYRRHKMKAERWKRFGWLQWLPLSFKSFMLAQWDVITKSHPWILTLSISTTYVIWGSSLILYEADLGEFYYQIVADIQTEEGTAVPPYSPPAGYDPLGYGQLLAAAVAFLPLWQVMCLIWGSRGKTLAWIKRYPTSLWNGVVFIFTGHRNPWKKVLARRTEDGASSSDSLYDSVPLTGPNDDAKTIGRTSTDEKFDADTLSNSAWKSTTSVDYSTVHPTSTTLYDPYNPSGSN
ncbi:hypothetical protein J3R30DRAFT_3753923 [Lentinula aciculospora]|uniref:Uncharacterized protein n=1 Tax=Lentinula aciculospora TaxID=153920 RepID=A0A9W9A9Z4_9AGAR|nr:hypothetical protein J3R30DRAFT_3753923 [Lentinula aciculospora]